MESYYPLSAWKRSTEVDITECIQELYSKKGYKTKNFHQSDRIHEQGVDLECEKGSEKYYLLSK